MGHYQVINKIGAGQKKIPISQKILFGPVIEKFFILGYLGGFSGTVLLGLMLWLMRHNIVEPRAWYNGHRELHIFVQIYMFLLPFIAGFFIQAGPTLFDLKSTGYKIPKIFLIIPFLIGPVLLVFNPALMKHNYFLAILLITLVCLTYFVKASLAGLLRSCLPALLCLIGFSLGLFLPLNENNCVALVLWLSLFGAIFSADQQFITGVLGGSRISNRSAVGVLILIIVVADLLFKAWITGESQYHVFAGVILLALSGLHIIATKLYSVINRNIRTPLGLAIYMGKFWLICSAVFFIIQPDNYIDSIIHFWGVGIAIPLLVAVSTRIIHFTGPGDLSKERQIYRALLIWQMVPILRSFSYLELTHVAYISITILLTIHLFFIWGSQLLPNAWIMFKRPLMKDY